MATVKVRLRPSTNMNRPGSIVYFVTHRRVIRQITTEYKLFSEEWDEKSAMPLITGSPKRTYIIQSMI